MSKVTGGCGGKQKGGKSSKKGCGSDQVSSKTVGLSTSNNSSVVTLLRKALRNDDGSDKDLLAEFPSFTKVTRNGLDLAVEFRCGKDLSKDEASACFRMAKDHMEDEYNSSGYGWDDKDKWDELTSKESRVLLLLDAERSVVGFVSFRLTLQGECWNAMEGAPCLFVYDLQLTPPHRRKGVGKQLALTLEMMAKKGKMSHVSALVTSRDELGASFFSSLRGWVDDTGRMMAMEAADTDDDTFRVYSKCIDGSVGKRQQEAQEAQQLAMQLAAMAAQAERTPPAKAEAEKPPAKATAKAEPEPAAADVADAADAAGGAAEGKGKNAEKNAKKKAKAKAKKAQGAGAEAEVEPAGEADAEAAAASAAGRPSPRTPEATRAEEGEEGPLSAARTAQKQPAQKQPFKFDLSADVSAAGPPKGEAEAVEAAPFKFTFQPVAGKEAPAGGAGAAPPAFPFQPAAGVEAPPAFPDLRSALRGDGGGEAEEGLGEEGDEVDGVIEGLCEMFEEQNGRAATEEEIKMWVATIKEANEAGAFAPAGGAALAA